MTQTVEYHPATDPGAFAEQVLGRPLWPHQLSVARSNARYRCICAGRQVGKSTTLSAGVALFEAATRRNITVLIVSAGETASRRLLEDCTALATASPLLGGSVVDDSKSMLTLSNGSRIISVPASQRQIRGWPVDVLIIDEAGFIDPEIWRAAEPAIIARPGSKVILVSTPWGGLDHFFRKLWQQGMDSPSEHLESWHWPSSVSPLVDEALLEQIRQRESAEYFRREFLAEFTDEAGAYFTESEIMRAVADYAMTAPEELPVDYSLPYAVAAGVDWGFAKDANALAMVSVMEDFGNNRNRHGDDLVFFVPWLEVKHGWAYSQFIDRVVEMAGSYRMQMIASELNGPGQYPTDDLADKLLRSGKYGWVAPVWTDMRRKQSGFSKIKGLLQRDRLVLPRHPELLKQLRGLEFEQTASGGMKISVPERTGHDDAVMALMQAVSCVHPPWATREQDTTSRWAMEQASAQVGEPVMTPSGIWVPQHPLPVKNSARWIFQPEGKEKGDGW